jgi:hypothetical protein
MSDISTFYNRLATHFPSWPLIPDGYEEFRAECEARYEAGIEQFGDAYLHRDNLAESLQEASDLANYMALDVLKHIDEGGDGEEDLSLALEAARHAYKAHETARLLAARRRGAP